MIATCRVALVTVSRYGEWLIIRNRVMQNANGGRTAIQGTSAWSRIDAELTDHCARRGISASPGASQRARPAHQGGMGTVRLRAGRRAGRLPVRAPVLVPVSGRLWVDPLRARAPRAAGKGWPALLHNSVSPSSVGSRPPWVDLSGVGVGWTPAVSCAPCPWARCPRLARKQLPTRSPERDVTQTDKGT
jgi:hypothetical protein